MSGNALCWLIGLTALVSSILYILPDRIESPGTGFSSTRLYLSYVAFVAVPFFSIGAHAVRRPRTGWPGLIGAPARGVSFIFFAGTAEAWHY